METRLRYLAEVNPYTPQFDRLGPDDLVTFTPLETIWADTRLDLTRTRPKADVATGYTRFFPGDVLVPKVTPTFQAGRSAIAGQLVNGVGAGTTELHVLRPRDGVDRRYLRYVVLSEPFLAEGVSAFQGVAGLQRIPDQFVRDFPVVAPEFDEQRRIADFLDAETSRLDALISAARTRESLIGERMRSILRRTALGFMGEQPASIEDWINRLPSDWQCGPLKRWWTIIDCRHVTPDYAATGYPVMGPGDIRPGLIDLSRATRYVDDSWFHQLASGKLRVRRGDIVYSRNASVGTATYIDTDAPFAMGQDVCRITSRRESQAYLAYVLNYTAAEQLNLIQVGSTFKRANIASLLEMTVPRPPRTVQDELARRMSASEREHRSLITASSGHRQLMVERRHALITAAVTGQIDVTTAQGVADRGL